MLKFCEEVQAMVDWPDTRSLGVVLYPKFGLLDVTGALHAFGALKNVFEPVLIGPEIGPVESAQGPALLATADYEHAPVTDLLLVPGGSGARERIRDDAFLAWLADRANAAELVMTVATGSALLARAGVLNGIPVTTGTRALKWSREQGPGVTWQPGARWVDAGRIVSAAGAAAGIDMALHVISRLTADDVGENVARSLEHDWHRDPAHDPFAAGDWNART